MNNIERAKLIKKIISDRALDPLTKRLYLGSVINCGVKPTGLLVGCKPPIFATTT